MDEKMKENMMDEEWKQMKFEIHFLPTFKHHIDKVLTYTSTYILQYLTIHNKFSITVSDIQKKGTSFSSREQCLKTIINHCITTTNLTSKITLCIKDKTYHFRKSFFFFNFFLCIFKSNKNTWLKPSHCQVTEVV